MSWKHIMVGIWLGVTVASESRSPAEAERCSRSSKGLLYCPIGSSQDLLDQAHKRDICRYLGIGLNRTSRPVRKSRKFSKSGLSGNRTFSFLDAGLLKIEKKIKIQKKNANFFSYFFCLFIW